MTKDCWHFMRKLGFSRKHKLTRNQNIFMKHMLISTEFLSGKIAKAQDIITGQNYQQRNSPSFKCRSSQQIKDSCLFSRTTQAPYPLRHRKKLHLPLPHPKVTTLMLPTTEYFLDISFSGFNKKRSDMK